MTVYSGLSFYISHKLPHINAVQKYVEFGLLVIRVKSLQKSYYTYESNNKIIYNQHVVSTLRCPHTDSNRGPTEIELS